MNVGKFVDETARHEAPNRPVKDGGDTASDVMLPNLLQNDRVPSGKREFQSL